MTWQEILSVFGGGSEFVVVAGDAVVVPSVFVGGRAAEPLHEGNSEGEYGLQQLRVVSPD